MKKVFDVKAAQKKLRVLVIIALSAWIVADLKEEAVFSIADDLAIVEPIRNKSVKHAWYKDYYLGQLVKSEVSFVDPRKRKNSRISKDGILVRTAKRNLDWTAEDVYYNIHEA